MNMQGYGELHEPRDHLPQAVTSSVHGYKRDRLGGGW